ncbi:MAG: hypothetical protein JXR94_21045 [Candidatus Hydrogenedentes bacterium]|nr:hypothetical protein [Candidatus Hydrogenedentota bacterium]
MSAGTHIGLFYSRGRNGLQALESLRGLEPDARICFIVPAGYPLSEAECAIADTVVKAERDTYSPADVRACTRLLRTIRAARFDRFVVLFPSVQLRMLGALSGARACVCLSPRGNLRALERSAVWVLAKAACAAIGGRLAYAALWLAVRLLPVPPGPD